MFPHALRSSAQNSQPDRTPGGGKSHDKKPNGARLVLRGLSAASLGQYRMVVGYAHGCDTRLIHNSQNVLSPPRSVDF